MFVDIASMYQTNVAQYSLYPADKKCVSLAPYYAADYSVCDF